MENATMIDDSTATSESKKENSNANNSSVAATTATKANGHQEATTTRTSVASSSSSSSLPLGWTKVKRRNRKQKGNTKDYDDGKIEDWFCCDDPSCPRPSNTNRAGTSLFATKDDDNNNDTTAASTHNIINGQVIICLHDINPSWFQGYFIPTNQTKPWGLLGVQEEIDECLECIDGGYRRITLSIYPFHNKQQQQQEQQKKKKIIKIQNIDWIGGDMMKLSNNFNDDDDVVDDVDDQKANGRSSIRINNGNNNNKNITTKKNDHEVLMETHRLLTGKKAVPFVKQYFNSIINKVRAAAASDDDDDDDDHKMVEGEGGEGQQIGIEEKKEEEISILKLLPNVAIAIGPMKLKLSKGNDDEHD